MFQSERSRATTHQILETIHITQCFDLFYVCTRRAMVSFAAVLPFHWRSDLSENSGRPFEFAEYFGPFFSRGASLIAPRT